MHVFLFTDIEGSTTKWEKHPDDMKKRLPVHDIIIMKSLEKYGGKLIKHTGDGFFAVFEDGEPLECALEIQDKMQNADWGALDELRVRIGLHAGMAEKKGNDYFGPVVNRASRIMGIAWGGQTVFTKSVKDKSNIPSGAEIIDHGQHMLKDLGEPVQVFAIIRPDLPLKEFPPLRSLSSHQHNLPAQSTPFIGRNKELQEITKLICNSQRLITLSGPGGIGKTRLAIQAAADVFENFKQGIFFIPLDRLDSSDFIISSIAQSLKFSFHGTEDEKIQLYNYLRGKEILFVFDNFEHVIDGAPLVSDILKESSRTKALITSRETLNLKGEYVYKVEGLELPEKMYEEVEKSSAVQLFLQNAQRVNPDIEFSDIDKQSIVDICQILEGQPLGIELASAWCKSIAPKEILTEIQANIDFLSTSMRDMPARHRSLRAVFDYSWQLLNDQEKEGLMKLSVFRGGFQRDAAKQVTEISLPTLSSFVDQSLLQVSSLGRYEMLYILKQYTEEKFKNEYENIEEVNTRHGHYYLDFIEQEDKKSNKDPVQVLDVITFELENIRKAWNWAIEKEKTEAIDKAAAALHRFYIRRGLYKEGKALFNKAIKKLEGKIKNSLYACLLRYYAIFCTSIGNYKEAKRILEHSLNILKNLEIETDIAATLNQLGEAERFLGKFIEAEKHITQSLDIYTRNNNEEGIAQTMNYLAHVSDNKGDHKKVREYGQKSLALWEKIGDPYGIIQANNILGGSCHGLGEYDKATEYYLAGLETTKKIGHKAGIATIYNNLAIIYSITGDEEKGSEFFKKSIEVRKDLGDRRGVAMALSNLGVNEHNKHNYKASLKYQEEAHAISKEIGYKTGIASTLLNMVETLANQKQYDKAHDKQKEGLKIARAIGDSWLIERGLLNLGMIFHGLEKYKESKKSYRDGLKMAYENGHMPMVSVLFVGIGRLLLDIEEKEKALLIFYFLRDYPATPEVMLDDIIPSMEQAETELSKSQCSAILKKAKSQDVNTIVEKVLNDLTT